MTEANSAQPLERRVIVKLSWRILPLIFLSYMIAVMDRANISYASVQMNASLGFSAAVYGFGAGVFFLGYSLFEIPSNMMMVRFGARRWIARIMLTMPAASEMLHPANRAVAFAAINTIAQVGNFLGPFLWGYAADRTGSFLLGLGVIPIILLAPLGLILMMDRNKLTYTGFYT
jgi:MFS transporter, ACS family, tartrate transporter